MDELELSTHDMLVIIMVLGNYKTYPNVGPEFNEYVRLLRHRIAKFCAKEEMGIFALVRKDDLINVLTERVIVKIGKES